MATPQGKPPETVIHGPSPDGLIEALRRQIARLEGARRPQADGPISSGAAVLDELLPERGFRRGTLVEWLAEGEGTGVQTIALGVAAGACREGGALVVLDRRREFYPPAAARLGIALEGLIVVHALGEADYAWALDQALRCPAVAAVLAWPERLDGRTFRRLQLAAEQGGGLGLFLRPASVRNEPSWADVRLEVEPLPSGGGEGQWIVDSGQWTVGRGQETGDRGQGTVEEAASPRPFSGRRYVGPLFPTHYSRPTIHYPLSTIHFLRTGRRLRVRLLRCRGGNVGGSVEMVIDDETGTVHPAGQLADREAGSRAAGA